MGALLVFLVVMAAVHTGRNRPAPPAMDPCERVPGERACVRMVNPVVQREADYRGTPRVVTSQKGVVAADQGRCSDIGAAVLDVSAGVGLGWAGGGALVCMCLPGRPRVCMVVWRPCLALRAPIGRRLTWPTTGRLHVNEAHVSLLTRAAFDQAVLSSSTRCRRVATQWMQPSQPPYARGCSTLLHRALGVASLWSSGAWAGHTRPGNRLHGHW